VHRVVACNPGEASCTFSLYRTSFAPGKGYEDETPPRDASLDDTIILLEGKYVPELFKSLIINPLRQHRTIHIPQQHFKGEWSPFSIRQALKGLPDLLLKPLISPLRRHKSKQGSGLVTSPPHFGYFST